MMRAIIVLLTTLLSAVSASQRISGGAVTTIATYPFAASLTHNRLGVGVFQIACGGSIISSRSVLTAAYCVHNEQTERWRIRVGSVNAGSGGVLHTAQDFVAHPLYNPVTKENDIGIVHVHPHFLFTTNIQLGNLPSWNYIPAHNQTVWAIGWGAVNHGGLVSESLRRVQLSIVENLECKFRYNELDGPNVTENMVCALGLDRTGKGQCLGDNGSPLLDDLKYIIGVYSWSHQCGTVRYPGVNTFIPSYLHWIETSQRISGGVVTIAMYPFAASLTHNRLGIGVFQIACGGSIISSRSVLTAAYCVYNEQTERWRIRVGSVNAESGGVLHTAQDFVVHPLYNPVTKENDIGIVHVHPHFLFTNTNVRLGNLPGRNYVPTHNQIVWAIGWGAVNHGGLVSESLRQVQLSIVENLECKFRYNELDGPNVTEDMVCALGLDRTGKGQCLGDNGSPLLDELNYIIGVYSWSHQCGTVRYPGVNTFIPSYLNWIESNY